MWCLLQGIEPLEIPSRRFTNLVWYKLIEGLSDESIAKLTMDVDSAARRIRHPLDEILIQAPQVLRSTTPVEPKKRERKPPPGWLDDRTAFNNAMGVMNFNSKKRR